MTREDIAQILNKYAVDLFAHGLRYGYETNTPLLEKIADEIVSSLPPAECAEAIVKKYEDEYDFKFHWVQRDRVIRMMREFAAQPQPKLDPKKVQWSGYGELGNISQKPLQPTAEGAEEIEAELRGYARDIVRLHKPIMEVNPQLAMDSIGNDLVKMFNRLAQRIAEKMVEERMEQYKAQFKDRPNPLEVNPYDSKGIKRIRNRKIH